MDEFNRSLELIIIAVYMLFLLGIGIAFRRFNSDISDFFRGGGKGTWWLVGSSAFMAGISAYTFTGASGVAFKAGWSVASIYIANSLGFLLAFLFFAPWFRQLRAITAPEVIRLRYGAFTQQFYAYFSVIIGVLGGGLQLWAMGIFASVVFGINISIVILVVGSVVVFYSTTGGSWAVMATDFVQSLVMVPLTILIAVLCLIEVGGFSGLSQLINTTGLGEQFKLINEPGTFPFEQFTFAWAMALIVKNSILSNTIVSGQRYFSVKDGQAARKAALLAFVLMSCGAVFWFIPPMVGRLLYESEVMAIGSGLNSPAEASYAVTSMMLLPTGATALIVVAMFSATMSSLDSGINRSAGMFVRDIYPALSRFVNKETMEEKGQLILGRIFSLLFGGLIILIALYFAVMNESSMFDVMLNIGAMLSVPLSIPMLLGLFFKRVPAWSAIFSMLVGMAPALCADVFSLEWNFQTKVYYNLIFGGAAFLLTIPAWSRTTEAYRQKVDDFFERMHKPVDFEKEVGEANDLSQLTLIGGFTLAIAAFLALLILIPNPLAGRLAILSIALTVFVVGMLMVYVGRKGKKNEGNKANIAEENS